MTVTSLFCPLGIIGYGNMGSAVAQGLMKNEQLQEKFPLVAYTRGEKKRAAMQAAGIVTAASASALVHQADYIIVAVKPEQLAGVLLEIAPLLTGDKVIISLAAGVSLRQLREASNNQCPVVRVMPNTLVAAGEGLFGVCMDAAHISSVQRDVVWQLFSGLGQAIEVPEDKMNAFSALAGCGPAYVYYFAEALIESGVTLGMKRADATSIVYSLLRGSVALATAEGTHPSLLREQVTSPGGMTIAGTNRLDALGVRGAVVNAVLAAKMRGDAMGKEK